MHALAFSTHWKRYLLLLFAVLVVGSSAAIAVGSTRTFFGAAPQQTTPCLTSTSTSPAATGAAAGTLTVAPTMTGTSTKTPTFSWLHVSSGGLIVNEQGCSVPLAGVNMGGLFLGDADGGATLPQLSAFTHAIPTDVVRVTFNSQWWNTDVPVPLAHTSYRKWLQQYVAWQEQLGNYVELDAGPHFPEPPCGGTVKLCPSQNQGAKDYKANANPTTAKAAEANIAPEVQAWTDLAKLYAQDPAILYDAWNEPVLKSLPTFFKDMNTLIDTIRAQKPRALVIVYQRGYQVIMAGKGANYKQPNLIIDAHIYDGFKGTSPATGQACQEPGKPGWTPAASGFEQEVSFAHAHGQGVIINEWGGCYDEPNYHQQITSFAQAHGVGLAYFQAGDLVSRSARAKKSGTAFSPVSAGLQLNANGKLVAASYTTMLAAQPTPVPSIAASPTPCLSPSPTTPIATPTTAPTTGTGTGTPTVTDTASPPASPIPTPPGASCTPTAIPTGTPTGMLHVQGTAIVGASGTPIILRGAQIESGFNYSKRWQSGEKPTTVLNSTVFTAMVQQWHMNVLRVPLSNWIEAKDPTTYMSQLDQVVTQANTAGLYVILDLHDNAKSGSPYGKGANVPKSESVAFWKLISAHFKANPMVLYDPFNEPSMATWQEWLKGGGTVGGATEVGFQDLVTAIRSSGAQQIIVLEPGSAGNGGGQGQGNAQAGAKGGGWATFPQADAIADPNLVYSLHVYSGIADSTAMQDAKWGPVLGKYPVLYGEWGMLPNSYTPAQCRSVPHDQADQVVNAFLTYMDTRNASWVAWDFSPFHLVQDGTTFTPTTLDIPWTCGDVHSHAGMGSLVKAHLQQLTSGTPQGVTPTPTIVTTP